MKKVRGTKKAKVGAAGKKVRKPDILIENLKKSNYVFIMVSSVIDNDLFIKNRERNNKVAQPCDLTKVRLVKRIFYLRARSCFY